MTIYKKQSGTVLVVALIILSVLTILGVTSMKSSIIEEKMTGNLRDSELAFQAAESAMRQAEAAVNAIPNRGVLGTVAGLLDDQTGEPDLFNAGTWTPASSIAGTQLAGGQLADTPRFIIKYVEDKRFCDPPTNNINPFDQFTPDCATNIFRITALGTGLSPNTQVVLQGYFGRGGL